MIEVAGMEIPPALRAYPHIVAAIIPDIAEAIRSEIVRLANERLHTSTEDYVAGVQPVKYHMTGRLPPPGRTVASITLVGELPNMIEQGWAGGDMKPALLAGRNAKRGKDGKRYNTVPFRHGTPGTTGRNFAPMGSAYGPTQHTMPGGGMSNTGRMTRENAARLGKAIHREAKNLGATTSHAHSGTKWGERLPPGHAPKLREHHSTDIYAGMVRYRKTYKTATQSQYGTFRRVSENSDPQAWIHPGIEGHRLFQEGAKYSQKIAGFLLQQAVIGVQRGVGHGP